MERVHLNRKSSLRKSLLAIVNLLSNASKATRENDVICISSDYCSNYVYGKIKDSGDGFDWSPQEKFLNQLIKIKALSIPDRKTRCKSP